MEQKDNIEKPDSNENVENPEAMNNEPNKDSNDMHVNPEASAHSENAAQDDSQEKDGGLGRRARRRHAERQMEELTQKVEQMGAKLQEMNEKYMRVYSEYDNYRKRTSKEKTDLILNGGKDIIKLMLPIVDDMERALANMADGDAAKEGMALIHKNMMNALSQKGLKPMDAKGQKFDENFHEAITQIPAPSPEAKGMVIDVVKKGYFLNDEVLRFAQVVVGC